MAKNDNPNNRHGSEWRFLLLKILVSSHILRYQKIKFSNQDMGDDDREGHRRPLRSLHPSPFPPSSTTCPNQACLLPISQTSRVHCCCSEGVGGGGWGAEGRTACWSQDWWGFSLGNSWEGFLLSQNTIAAPSAYRSSESQTSLAKSTRQSSLSDNH